VGTTNSKPETGSSSHIIFITLFSSRCIVWLHFLLASANWAQMQEKNQFPEPNQHLLTFLHPILMCRVTYWALMVMVLQFRNFDYADLAMQFGVEWLTVLDKLCHPKCTGHCITCTSKPPWESTVHVSSINRGEQETIHNRGYNLGTLLMRIWLPIHYGTTMW
jgi:hypothetical protein